MAEGRRKRACVTRKALVPSAVHYVGYVEEGETPEMIMKKFEELDRIMAQQKAVAANSTGDEPAAGPSGASSHGREDARDSGNAAGPSDAGAGAADAMQQDGGDGMPDNEQLLQIFKATSIFNVRSAMANNEVLMAGDHNPEAQGGLATWSDGELCSDDDDCLDELRGFWSDDDGWDTAKGRKGRRPKQLPKGERPPHAPRPGGQGASKARIAVVTQYNRDTNAFIRRKMRVVDPDAIVQLRIPDPPLPLSWGRRVLPYVPPAAQAAAVVDDGGQQPASTSAAASSVAAAGGAADCLEAGPTGTGTAEPGSSGAAGQTAQAPAASSSSCCFVAPDLTTLDFKRLHQAEFQALLINTGWECDESDGDAGARDEGATAGPSTAARQQPYKQQRRGSSSNASMPAHAPALALARLAQLPIPQLCPKGFVFTWAPKQHIQGIMRQMYAWDYCYVENLTWVLLHPNNSVLRVPSAYAKVSHITLLIFRKDGEGRNIELRHQRNPDVIFDCMTAAPGREWAVPGEVYRTIETMLPTGMGSFLELWAAADSARPGWMHVAECTQL